MNEQGSMLPFMAALIFVGLVVTGLALDVALLAATYRETAYAADVGAEAGAAVVAVGQPGDDPSLDPPAAEEAGMAAAVVARRRAVAPVAVASATADEVCVTVTNEYRPRILGALGVAPVEISIEACAEPRSG
jgi:hypothetical protein